MPNDRVRVVNVHERLLLSSVDEVGALIDSLSSRRDRLWPCESWPRMRFDRPLQVGASGGHGPIRYDISAYKPGQSITFRFRAPRGFEGTHRFEIVRAANGIVLRHTLEMNARGRALVTWPLLFRPLHDALIEDCLDKAERAVTNRVQRPAVWSRHVRALRWLVARGRPRSGASTKSR
jgi:hypothetical protein